MSTNHNFWRERRAEAVSNRGPSAYQPTALPLGQTGSRLGARLLPQSYIGGQLRGGKECPFSGVTKSGRIWRKVPKSDARSLEEGAEMRCSEFGLEGAEKRCSEFGGRCRKAMLGVWYQPTLRASLSGTFLQTLPDLVTPLKRHSLSPHSCPATRSAPSGSFG